MPRAFFSPVIATVLMLALLAAAAPIAAQAQGMDDLATLNSRILDGGRNRGKSPGGYTGADLAMSCAKLGTAGMLPCGVVLLDEDRNTRKN